jgi:hypothetical protein
MWINGNFDEGKKPKNKEAWGSRSTLRRQRRFDDFDKHDKTSHQI